MRRTYEQRLERKNFRMDIVLIINNLSPQERARVVNGILREKHVIPWSKKEYVSKTTIYRWLREYRQNQEKEEVLLSKVRADRGIYISLTPEQQKALLKWRKENTYRTALDLQDELKEHESTCTPYVPSTSTIARFLRSKGLSRAVLIAASNPDSRIRMAFEAEYAQQIWMADTKGPDVYVTDPKDPSRLVQARPISLIDAYSRYLLVVVYVIIEDETAVLDCFIQAISRFGIPETLYTDRGGPYMGGRLKRAANLVGCRLMHAGKGQCQSKGLVEKVLRTIHERFEHEMKVSMKTGVSLNEYNLYVTAHIEMEYNRIVHSSTGETPSDRYGSFPPELRRWVSKEYLMLIGMPCRKAAVSKTGLIRVNNLRYLVPDAMLWGKKLDVRYSNSDRTRVHVWHEDKYYGEAHVFVAGNDSIKRKALLEAVQSSIIAETGNGACDSVPTYSRLERQLARYREEMDAMGLNRQLEENKRKKEEVRAALLPGKPADTPNCSEELRDGGVKDFTYLLMRLLRRPFNPSERLAVHTLWNAVGPIDEKVVRQTVGRLLGEEHPVEDLSGFLEEIRLCVLTSTRNERGY